MRISRTCVVMIALIVASAMQAKAGDPQPLSPPSSGFSVPATPLPLGLIMEQNGGSLMRAQAVARAANPDPAGEARPDGPPGSVVAVSLFAVAEPKPKSFKKHDLVTIIAKEQSAYTASGNSKQTKEQSIDDQLQSFIAIRPSLNQIQPIIGGGSSFPEIKITNNRDFNGTGEVDRTDTFSDRVTAEVVDVKPNGTLVLQAIKHIKTDEEDQRMILTGICRAEDVTADNSVLTTQLFDMELTQSHTGAVADTTSRGFFPRLLDTFSPF